MARRPLRPQAAADSVIRERGEALLWLEQWKGAGLALAEIRRRELAELSEERALAISDSLLRLGAELPLSASRLESSGLVRQQEILHRSRGR